MNCTLCVYYKPFLTEIVYISSHGDISVCCSIRSRDDDRASKPGAMSTPVKSSDDGVLSQGSDQASSRDEKILPPLPGTNSLFFIINVSIYALRHINTMMPVHKIYQIEIYPFIKMGRGKQCNHFDGQTSEMSSRQLLQIKYCLQKDSTGSV